MVWQARRTDAPAVLADLALLISTEEHARLERLRVREDQQRFLIGRGLLRLLAGAHLKISPKNVELSQGPHGKPCMVPRNGTPTLHFNVSHSGEWVLLAFSQTHEVGVDVEAVRPCHDWEAIAERVFSADAYRSLTQLNPEEREAAFFQAWARHEARLKTLGGGFGNENSDTPDTRLVCFDLVLPEGYQGAAGCLL